MNIDRIRKNIVGDYGLSSSNQYHVSFEVPMGVNASGDTSLSAFMRNRGFSIEGVSDPEIFGSNSNAITNMTKLSFLADEINIPGYSVATGDFKGYVPGINARYAHTRNFTEMNIAFLMDMSHTPLKFLRLWSDYIFGFEEVGGSGGSSSTVLSQLEYYNNYAHDIIIDKLEPNTSGFTKSRARSSMETHNVITRTRLHKAFPYMVNDLTVSNAPNQPMRLQSTFYYEYFTTENFDASNPSPTASDTKLSLNFLNNGVFSLGSQSIG